MSCAERPVDDGFSLAGPECSKHAADIHSAVRRPVLAEQQTRRSHLKTAYMPPPVANVLKIAV
jgi:hypothetical protein